MPKFGQLQQVQIERVTVRNSWYRNAYRITDAHGRDMVQPYALTKKEARETARALNIELVAFPADTLDSYEVITANGVEHTMTGGCLLNCYLRSVDNTVISWRAVE